VSSQTILRQQGLHARKQLSDEQVYQYSQQIIAKLMTQHVVQHASIIAGYLPYHNEVNLTALFQWCWQQHKTLLLPQCDTPQPGLLTWLCYTSNTPLISNRYDLLEPDPQYTTSHPIEHIDLVLAPLVAFDTKLHRIGMGGGYYDRTFANQTIRPTMIGCAFNCQQVHTININPWDINLDTIITEKKVYT